LSPLHWEEHARPADRIAGDKDGRRPIYAEVLSLWPSEGQSLFPAVAHPTVAHEIIGGQKDG
jgi:hypothetical protein